MGITGVEPEGPVRVDAGVHAGQYGQTQLRWGLEAAIVEVSDVVGVGVDEVGETMHRMMLRPWGFETGKYDPVMPWQHLIRAAEVPPGAVVAVDAGQLELVVWRSLDGRPVVCDGRCPHQWSHFGAEGVVDGAELVCLSHWWRFDADGRGSKVNVKGRRDPKGDVAVFACREHDGVIEVDLPGPDGADVGTLPGV